MRAQVGDMTFVVRAAGERTGPAVIALLRELIARAGGDPAAQVSLLNEPTFAEALRRTLEVGLHAGRPWLIALDADTLLLDSALDRLAALCSRAEPDVFKIGPLVLCKFHGGLCHRAVHAYPHHLLERALRRGPSPAELRPETALAHAMAREGFASFSPATVLGVHDFEQSFRHIYLKMRLRALREARDESRGHADASFPALLARTEDLAARTRDPDYLVASWGLRDGQADAAAGAPIAAYDWSAPHPDFESRLHAASLAEKPRWPGPARGHAERLIAAHDFHADRRTPEWVRQHHGFTAPHERILGKLGVSAPNDRALAARPSPEAAA